MIRRTEPPAPADDATTMPFSQVVTSDHVRSARELTKTMIRIAVWSIAHLSFLLAAWVFLGWSLAGWTPVVITSGSMTPTLDVGDVVLVADDTSIGQRDIIVFERGDELVAHRVFAVEYERYVTKGDANPAPDLDRAHPDDIVGSGRLVVPMIGLPIVWAQQGQWLPLLAWAALAGAGVIGTALAADRALRRLRGPPTGPPVSLSRAGVQRIRVLTAVLILGQHFVGENAPFDVRDPGMWFALGAVAVLMANNTFSSVGANRESSQRRRALFELAIDTALMIVLSTAGGSSAFSWVLFALPIIEAAVRFRLVGALVHWTIFTVTTMSIEVWRTADESNETALASLEQILDQLSVLFLLVIPAAYLAEQLLGELSSWHRATGQAVDRSDLLAHVADVGRDIVRLDNGYVEQTVNGIRSLGFDRVDLIMDEIGGSWHVVAGDENLPVPGSLASGVCEGELSSGGSIVALDDPNPDEVAALTTHCLEALIAHVVSDVDGRRLVARAGIDAGGEIGPERIEALGLLAGQASVALRNDRLMGEVHAIHGQLEHQALHDGLTGLPNRTQMLRRLAEVQATDATPIVLFLDLDGFKPVNDRLGHDAGDRVLQTVAKRLSAVVPQSAFVTRLGGDEFTVLLTDCDQEAALIVSTHIVDAIGEPIAIDDDLVHISTSIGIAVGGPGVGDAEVIRRADVAMYDAKHNANSRPVEVYRRELDEAAERRMCLTSDIEASIAAGQVGLVYQPIVDVSGRQRIVGAEALLRWLHPVHGAIPPGEAIAVAHAAGVSHVLNQHILDRSCEWIAEALRVSDTDLFVAVNASPEELGASSLTDNVAAAALRAGVSLRHVAMEISERIVTPVSDATRENMETLRSMGVRLLLDDFGEGTTSLTYLQELPIDGVKIDRRLVVNASRSRTDRLVLESIIELSLRIGHSVIAEGVEDDEHFQSVIRAGCTLMQGYLLARPIGGSELLGVLAAERLEQRQHLVDEPDSTPSPTAAGIELPDYWNKPLVEPGPPEFTTALGDGGQRPLLTARPNPGTNRQLPAPTLSEPIR